MRRATKVERAGHWPAEQAAAKVTLGYDDRHRRRLRLADDAGAPFLLDLAEACVLMGGDGLALDDGGWLEVRAADEPVVEATCADAAACARLAWHLGNRHVPTQVVGLALRFRPDPVIVDMVARLGARIAHLEAPFTPEAGAYGAHGHHHG
jgi:urease accessory protein